MHAPVDPDSPQRSQLIRRGRSIASISLASLGVAAGLASCTGAIGGDAGRDAHGDAVTDARNDSGADSAMMLDAATDAASDTGNADVSMPPDGGAPLALNGFFPIGVFVQQPSSFATWRMRGINTLVEVPQGQDLEAWTTAANAAGLRMIRAPRTDLSRDIAEPLLLAWSQNDEPDRTGNPTQAGARTIYDNLHMQAPQIPVFMNFSGFDVLGTGDMCNGPGDGTATDTCYPAYINSGDWIGNDNYPVAGYYVVGSSPGPDLALVGRTLDRLATWSGGRPQLVYIESSDQDPSWLGAPSASRGPTPAEFRAEIWDAVIHGARGIIYFPVRPFNGFLFDNTPPAVVTEMTAQDATLTALAPVLQSAINPSSIGATVMAPLQAGWRETASGKYFIALSIPRCVNPPTDCPRTTQTITLHGIGSATSAMVYGESRTVPIAAGGVITDMFDAFQVHIYVVN